MEKINIYKFQGELGGKINHQPSQCPHISFVSSEKLLIKQQPIGRGDREKNPTSAESINLSIHDCEL
jgi:hypothetical protein